MFAIALNSNSIPHNQRLLSVTENVTLVTEVVLATLAVIAGIVMMLFTQGVQMTGLNAFSSFNMTTASFCLASGIFLIAVDMGVYTAVSLLRGSEVLSKKMKNQQVIQSCKQTRNSSTLTLPEVVPTDASNLPPSVSQKDLINQALNAPSLLIFEARIKALQTLLAEPLTTNDTEENFSPILYLLVHFKGEELFSLVNTWCQLKGSLEQSLEGKLPIEIAMQYKHIDIATLFTKYKSPFLSRETFQNELKSLVEAKAVDLLQIGFEKYPDLVNQSIQEKTCLEWLFECASETIDPEQFTPFLRTIHLEEFITSLLGRNSSLIKIQFSNGETPIQRMVYKLLGSVVLCHLNGITHVPPKDEKISMVTALRGIPEEDCISSYGKQDYQGEKRNHYLAIRAKRMADYHWKKRLDCMRALLIEYPDECPILWEKLQMTYQSLQPSERLERTLERLIQYMIEANPQAMLNEITFTKFVGRIKAYLSSQDQFATQLQKQSIGNNAIELYVNQFDRFQSPASSLLTTLVHSGVSLSEEQRMISLDYACQLQLTVDEFFSTLKSPIGYLTDKCSSEMKEEFEAISEKYRNFLRVWLTSLLKYQESKAGNNFALLNEIPVKKLVDRIEGYLSQLDQFTAQLPQTLAENKEPIASYALDLVSQFDRLQSPASSLITALVHSEVEFTAEQRISLLDCACRLQLKFDEFFSILGKAVGYSTDKCSPEMKKEFDAVSKKYEPFLKVLLSDLLEYQDPKTNNNIVHLFALDQLTKNEEHKWLILVALERLLQDQGDCVINAPNKEDNSPLHLAVEKQNYEAFFLLWSLGAEGDLQNKEKKTPYDLANSLSSSFKKLFEIDLASKKTIISRETKKSYQKLGIETPTTNLFEVCKAFSDKIFSYAETLSFEDFKKYKECFFQVF